MSETNAARGYEKSPNDFGGKFTFSANFMTKSMFFIIREEGVPKLLVLKTQYFLIPLHAK
jgi:hypothetical protein